MYRLIRLMFSTAGLMVASLSGPALAYVFHFPQAQAPVAPIWFELGKPGSTLGDQLWTAQCEGDCYDDDEYDGEGATATKGASLNKGFTKEILKIIRSANATCDDDRILLKYRIDCLRVYYGWAADAMPDTGEYLPIKKALRRAESKLSAIVSANVDPDEPAIRPRDNHKKNAKKLPPLRAVKKSSEKKAVAQAREVVKETELVILRSGEDPSRREPHYTEVAAAVDSNLVILRSA